MKLHLEFQHQPRYGLLGQVVTVRLDTVTLVRGLADLPLAQIKG